MKHKITEANLNSLSSDELKKLRSKIDLKIEELDEKVNCSNCFYWGSGILYYPCANCRKHKYFERKV